ncbi:ATP-binding protein [Coleofasciculus sp. FACHB-64]|uniref:ATP-binding protein n=1 Tax=Cyanophyceae TaxID=3028117 RepID=UPI0016840E31|nr:ATP-binding protein [Coleofasciculus sp. FACHB-64]MBD2045011.1 ATP-binding protein [Coleofasciculus sp. FACHB-64]
MNNVLKEELSKQEVGQIRSNIERIISSYRHVWDIYTELLQNSADAIIEYFGEDDISQGKIQLEIEPNERKITIIDNGVGIEESEISKILVTGKSLKRERNTGKFGFMGYGFTFVAFQSDYLKIESIKNEIKASRTYRNLYKFVYSGSDIPNSEEEEAGYTAQQTSEPNSTKITVSFPKQFPNEVVEEALAATFRIAQSDDTIRSVLRTRSIVGMLEPVFNNSDCFKFKLIISNREVNIKTGYLAVKEIVNTVLNSDSQFYDRPTQYELLVKATAALPTVAQDLARKAIVLEEKIDNVRIGERNPLNVRVFISATSKSHINEFNERFRNKDDISSDFNLEHGLWLAIGGMPIGVCLDPFEHSNYLPYTVIVDVKDTSIRKELDAGRKGISAYRMKQITDKVLEILKEKNFIKYRRYIVGGGDSRIGNPLYDPKKELSDKLEDKKWFDSYLTQKYFPPLEEQEVISLFVELVAKQIIKGYYLKVLSGYQVYDGLYDYDLEQTEEVEYSENNKLGIYRNIFNANGGRLRKEILIEFKKDLKNIYNDINTNKKDISHIDVLVCWDVDFENKEKLQKEKGDVLAEKGVTTNVFYGSTHQLIGAGRQQALPIIELKKVLEITLNYKGGIL